MLEEGLRLVLYHLLKKKKKNVSSLQCMVAKGIKFFFFQKRFM